LKQKEDTAQSQKVSFDNVINSIQARIHFFCNGQCVICQSFSKLHFHADHDENFLFDGKSEISSGNKFIKFHTFIIASLFNAALNYLHL
jgi:hypothetical protein